MNLRLDKLTYENKDKIIELLDEWRTYNENNPSADHSPWAIFRNDHKDFDYYIANLEIKEGTDQWVPGSVFFCYDIDRDIYVGYGIATSVEDKSVTYAIRPEKLLVTTEMPTCEHNWSSGKVHDIAYLGGHSVFYVELPSGKLVQSFVANAERRGQRPTWGDQVYVWWEDDSGVVLRS